MPSTRARCATATVLGCAALVNLSCAAPSKPAHHPEIVQVGHAVLRERAGAVDASAIATAEFQALIDRMIRVMREAPGVGLAAPQLGIPLRVFVMEDRADLLARQTPLELAERERIPFPVRVWVNPEVVVLGERRATFFEGCLSVAGYSGLVERAHEVELRGLDREGKTHTLRVKGWPARIVQHELDHLDGTVYVDRMQPRSFMEAAAAKPRFGGKPIASILAELGVAPPAPGAAAPSLSVPTLSAPSSPSPRL
ncbi:MAG: peptide deformylase [Deltaproteobacteria bacterium]|nr:peptide deformylase [Deltaproteobacteria bacterium]